MTVPKNLEFAYLRTEAYNKVTLFLPIDPNILGQTIDLTLTDDRKLLMTFENGESQQTATLPHDIYYHLANRDTTVLFTDQEGNMIATHDLVPLKPDNPFGIGS
jgi:hypothetical protein